MWSLILTLISAVGTMPSSMTTLSGFEDKHSCSVAGEFWLSNAPEKPNMKASAICVKMGK